MILQGTYKNDTNGVDRTTDAFFFLPLLIGFANTLQKVIYLSCIQL